MSPCSSDYIIIEFINVRRVVVEGSYNNVDFPADCLHQLSFTALIKLSTSQVGYSEVPAYSQNAPCDTRKLISL